jgi:aspartate/methionine/tyrosine aminotransferase
VTLSERGEALRAPLPEMEYVAALGDIAGNLWHPVRNPDGVVQLAVAENVHTWADLEPLCRETVAKDGFAPFVPHYGDFRGNERCREMILRFLRRYVFVSEGMPLAGHAQDLSIDHMLLTNGCGPALEHVTFALCDPGDVILTPAPIYAGFLMDVGHRAQAKLVTVPMGIESPYRLDLGELDRARHKAQSAGQRVRGLLLSQPYNPVGMCLSVEEVRKAVRWCRDHGLHLISDEIYAASVFGAGMRHTSAIAFAADDPPWADSFLHILYGFSKDFGLSGFRVGLIYTSSALLHEALDRATYFCGCSSLPQYLITAVLSDDDFVDGYVDRNRRRLGRLYQTVVASAAGIGIPHIAADSGFFVWLDLRRWLPESTPAGERALWSMLVADAGVVLTPGLSCHASEPGMFRLCFAAVPEGGLEVAFERIGKVLQRSKPS